MAPLSCAFTGHRPGRFSFGYDESHPNCIMLKKRLEQQIFCLWDMGVTRFYTGCAQGVDMWAGAIVLELMQLRAGLELYCVVPFEEQAARWPEQQQDRYYTMLADCTGVIMLQTHYSSGCFLRRNQYLVNHADILLAVGEPDGRSGTAATIRCARALGKDVLLIHPDDLRMQRLSAH